MLKTMPKIAPKIAPTEYNSNHNSNHNSGASCIVTLLLGSNLGNSEALLCDAIELIRLNVGVVLKKTQVLENEANGFESEHLFYNQIILVETIFTPHQLLEVLEDIERQLGRVKPCCDWRRPREYSDRTIDIDILYYDNQLVSDEKLEIPHPKIGERDFVLQLLEELDCL